MQKYNFYAGPAILPASVFEEAAAGVRDLNGIGLSVLEISHRSAEFTSIIEEAEALVRELLQVSDDYAVLFMTGGASSQFYISAMNLLGSDETAAYIDTGAWSAKAIKEARLFGEIDILASSKEDNYTHIPKDYTVPAEAKYVHLTSNNTIFGTQFHDWPKTDAPLVCDMSSDIFSRRLPLERFGMIYAGAQKNMGPAGVTLVIIRKDLVNKIERDIPTILNYQTFIDKNSLFNTPPVFPIYVSMLNLRWVKAQGGLAKVEAQNIAKANVLYEEIDRNPLFEGFVRDKEDRSYMNVTFNMAAGKEALEADFLEAATAANCVGVKGHRSVGGFRASIYNAMSMEGIQTLVDTMRAFAQKHG